MDANESEYFDWLEQEFRSADMQRQQFAKVANRIPAAAPVDPAEYHCMMTYTWFSWLPARITRATESTTAGVLGTIWAIYLLFALLYWLVSRV